MQLYSAYSYPNIILPLFGGILIDLIGIYYGLLILSLLWTVGQGVFTLSATIGDSSTSNDTPFTLAMIGRVAYGIGDEIVAISLNIIISKWFEGKELSLAIGTTLSIAWFSNTVVNYSVSYTINSQLQLPIY